MKIKKTTCGRPPVKKEKKKSSHIFVNLTNIQKKKLVKIADEKDLSLSRLCLEALKKAGYI